jgi:hypothetical protein
VTTTLFIKDLDRLKSSLRLSGSESRDSSQLLVDAVDKARLLFFKRLTSSVVVTLQAIASVDSPTTPDQLRRATAEMLEILIVRRDLLMTMPVFTMDPSTNQEVWNEDALVRKMTRRERDESVARMDAEIESFFSDILADSGSVNGLRIGVDEEVNSPPGRWTFDRRCPERFLNL